MCVAEQRVGRPRPGRKGAQGAAWTPRKGRASPVTADPRQEGSGVRGRELLQRLTSERGVLGSCSRLAACPAVRLTPGLQPGPAGRTGAVRARAVLCVERRLCRRLGRGRGCDEEKRGQEGPVPRPGRPPAGSATSRPWGPGRPGVQGRDLGQAAATGSFLTGN